MTRDIDRIKQQAAKYGHGYREPVGHVGSINDLAVDSLKGKAMREGGKGCWSRISDPKTFRKRLGSLYVACPNCGKDVMKRRNGRQKCARCGLTFGKEMPR